MCSYHNPLSLSLSLFSEYIMSSITPPPSEGGVVPSEATPPNGTIPIASDVTKRETGSDSTPDIIHKSNLPVLLIGDEEEVKSKTVKGHTRGSSVSSTPGSHLGTVCSFDIFHFLILLFHLTYVQCVYCYFNNVLLFILLLLIAVNAPLHYVVAQVCVPVCV